MAKTMGSDTIEALLSEPYEIKRLFSLERLTPEQERRLRLAPYYSAQAAAEEPKSKITKQPAALKLIGY